MRQKFKRTLLAAAASVLTIAAVSAPPALASGTVTVTIIGAGHVQGGDINCTRSADGVVSGTCSALVFDTQQCDDGPFCITIPGDVTLTQSPVDGSGFAFNSWGGCAVGPGFCTATTGLPADRAVTALFVDAQPPTATLTQPAAGSAVAGTIPLAVNATDNVGVDSVTYSVRGTALPAIARSPFGTTFDTRTVADGPATITAVAADDFRLSLPASANVTIDNTKPTLTVTGPDAQTFNPGTTQTWTLAAADATTGPPTVACSVVPTGEAAIFAPCTSATAETVSKKVRADYTLTVRATDRAGNATTATRTFKIDAKAPETTITSGPADGAHTSATALTWGIAASEPGSTFECRVFATALTPGPFAPCSSMTAHTASNFAPGTYAFEVRATGPFGDVDATPARRTVTIDGHGGGGTATTTSGGHSIDLVVVLTFGFKHANARTTKLNSVVVGSVPAGSTVTARCSSGCSKRSLVKQNASGSVSLKSMLAKPLKVKTTITVVVSKPGAVSVVKVLEIRARKAPLVRTLCQPPGAAKPVACT